MPQSPCYRPVHIKPVTGVMDNRSNPDEVPLGGYRYVENMHVPEAKKLDRMSGWTKAFAGDSPYNNGDLHDQLFDYTRQHITMLFEAVTPAGFTKLFAGTQNRIYARNSSTKNWKVISDLYGGAAQVGCSGRRWYAAGHKQTVIFTNGVDPILYHVIDQPAMEDNDQSVTTIPDLDTLNISKAKVVKSYGNLMFLMNIEQDGVWHPNRISWSDFDRPVSFLPSDESLAGFQDLDAGEAILEAREVKNGLLIMTTRGIWQLNIAGGETVVTVARRWKSGDGKGGILSYRNTLVSDGENLWYWGRDGIYRYGMFDQAPVIEDWLHRGTGLIFDGLDRDRCDVPCGGWEGSDDAGQTGKIWWSWPETGEECNSRAFVAMPDFEFTSYVDHGISAFVYHEPDSQSSLRDFVLERCICSLEDWLLYTEGFLKEGGFCYDEEPATCDTAPASFFSQTPLAVAPGVSTEDWTGEPDEDSLFAILGSIKVSDLCSEEFAADECNAEQAFIFASTTDMCLKESAGVHYRETCVGIEGCGTYELSGYKSRMLSGPLDLQIPEDDKNIKRFAIEAHTVLETIPATIALRIGVAATAVDPLDSNDSCVILWSDLSQKKLKCTSGKTAAQHLAQNTRPNDPIEWGVYFTGRYLYFDLVIDNPDVTPEDTGGIVSFSRFTFDAVAKPRSY